MASSSIWQSRPVFITSTFRDMHAERDWLRTRIFPELEERLRSRFHYLETIDLRWGVDSASAKEEHDREVAVLTVCLAEIKRSRPFLIGLLGDRYGWQPPAARINGAAREAGLTEDVSGKSVTELEILYGVLRSSEQQQRSWFYLREPLPYGEMPSATAARFSDLHSGEPDVDEKAGKLVLLKEELKTALPGRVRTYRARWDAARQSVREEDLESWGAQVLDDVWSDLEAETTAFLREAPQTWQEQDQWALEEFVESRVRGFVGRTHITNDLMDLASSPTADGATWAACVTGEAGSGKSSLFGHLYRSLREADVVLLAHAAGISIRSTQVDWMLRRWVGELAATVGHSDPLTDEAKPDEIDQAFSRLLHHVSQVRRVVLLIDALNQFEPTTRATHLTWLPRLWPANARLIATAIPGTQTQALLQRPATTEKPLIPVDRDEALAILRGICDRYHRKLNEEVEKALLVKHNAAAAPAFGNPLWLEIAVEELNLLDAQAFDRAEAEISAPTTAAERIVALLLSTVEQMPEEVEGLYGFMLDRAERQFGTAWTRAFVNVIGVSRAGWRESDLEALMPVLSGEPWDPLRFATLRRVFRAHVVQRGATAQWDFHHQQLRVAASRRNLSDLSVTEHVHVTIADHLESLAPDDPVRHREFMNHLLRIKDRGRAARHYASDLSDSALSGATLALTMLIVEVHDPAGLTSLLAAGSSAAEVGVLSNRILFKVSEALENRAPLPLRLEVLRTVEEHLTRLVQTEPRNVSWLRSLSVSHIKIGEILVLEGKLPDALQVFRGGLTILEQLALEGSASALMERDMSVCWDRIGRILQAQGSLPDAHEALCKALAIRERLAAVNPGDPGRQSDLSVSHQLIGEILVAQGNVVGASRAFRRSLAIDEPLLAVDPNNATSHVHSAICQEWIGSVLATQGDLIGACQMFWRCLAVRERLTSTDPGNRTWQRDLSVSLTKIGDALVRQGFLPDALDLFRRGLAIRERLAEVDPSHAQQQYDLAVSHERVGEVLKLQGSLDRAHDSFRMGLAIRKRLVAGDPRHTEWLRGLSASHDWIGLVLLKQGDLVGARREFLQALAISDGLAATDTSNAIWQRDLALSHERVGSVLKAVGNLNGALEAFWSSLTIRHRLATNDPGNAECQGDLSASHFQVGQLHLKVRRKAPFLNHSGRSLAILRRMKSRGMHLDKAAEELLWHIEQSGIEPVEGELTERAVEDLRQSDLRAEPRWWRRWF